MRDRTQIKTKGIILGTKIIGEKDKLLYIFTPEYGKIKAVALGALKSTSKFTGQTETLSICSFEMYKGPKRTIINEIKTENSHKNLRKDFKKITNALLISKVVNEFCFENGKIDGVFELIKESVSKIEKEDNENKQTVLALSFLVKFLELMGLLPDFKHHEFKKSDYHSKGLAHKYIKLLNFVKDQPDSEIKKISLKPDEEVLVKEIIKEIVENESGKELKIPI